MNTKELKDKILQMAIQGKLVKQDPNDEPAIELLKRIKQEKEQLTKEKKIKKTKGFPPIADDEKPFDIPESWEWVRLGEIGEYKKGPFGSSITKSMFVTKSATTAKIYEQKNAIKKDANLGQYYITESKYKELENFTVLPGDIIISCAGTIGEAYIIPEAIEKGIINQALMRVRLLETFNTNFFLDCFDFILKDQISSNSKGSAIKNIPALAILKKMPIPIPPLKEQQRIVEKIDQFFTLIDTLEGNKEEMLAAIEETRNKILEEALKGNLVEQDPNDEPAEELLKRIKQEKKQLVKEKKIKKTNELPPISDDEKPFDIPESWEWVRLGDIGQIVGGGTPKTGVKEYWEEGKITWVTPADFKGFKGKFISAGRRNITELGLTQSSTKLMPEGTVLFSSRAPIGYTAIASKEIATNQGFKSCIPFIMGMNGYIYYFFKHFGKIINEKASGTTFKEVSGAEVSILTFPIPPIEEQQRIVKKVDTMMTICDDLENQLLD